MQGKCSHTKSCQVELNNNGYDHYGQHGFYDHYGHGYFQGKLDTERKRSLNYF